MAVSGSDTSGVRRNLNSALGDFNKSQAKLSSGKRINKASDDPAGLAVAVSLTSSAKVNDQSVRNIADGGSLLEIADGALGQLSDIGTQVAELSTQAANGTLNDDQRATIQSQISQLQAAAGQIVSTTSFNGQNVFASDLSIQSGSGSDADSQTAISGLGSIASAISSLSSVDVSTQAGAQAGLDSANAFTASVSQSRGQIGATESRLQVVSDNNKVESDNQKAAASRIEDVDVADEVSKSVSSKIKADISTALQAQSGKLDAQRILGLLQ